MILLINHLKQPESGAIMFLRCDECGVTTIIHNEHAIRPTDGDAWMVRGICDKIHMPKMEFEIHGTHPLSFAVPRWSVI